MTKHSAWASHSLVLLGFLILHLLICHAQASQHYPVSQFLWLVVLTGIVAAVTAFGIGANDVANAFATSVGSEALTLRQAVVIAGVCEFVGASFLGKHVTQAVKEDLFDVSDFEGEEQLVMLGTLCANTAAGMWLLIATRFGLPVSTTHSIVGGICGFATVSRGISAIQWSKLLQMIAFWSLSPFISGILVALSFTLLRSLILRSSHSYRRVCQLMPILVSLTIAVNIFFVLYNGSTALTAIFDDIHPGVGILFCLVVGFFSATIVHALLMPRLRARAEAAAARVHAEHQQEELVLMEGDDSHEASFEDDNGILMAGEGSVGQTFDVTPDDPVAECTEGKDTTAKIHTSAEVFDPATESMFDFAMVVTACFASFAHGANDVANAVAPLALNVAIYNANGIPKSSPDVPIWILCMGGAGIVVGLAMMGWRVIQTMGTQVAKVTSSRGFVIQISMAVTVLFCTMLGVPVSSTHCQVGATVAIGLMEAGSDSVNWKTVRSVFAGWIMTFIFTGVISGGLYAIGSFALP
eukprot:NODE_1045_length_1741_cov_25.739362_g922_i0.p1 GENE.NODE_1045_length_1741_cov_25.739362_g922_i0~~NODE_1045_length_1741_cov_25.739362_g922_i0.p1  ORF type:complete len:547 (-),score=107.10 NODE_1045_length_1741_cov_25.739362_g922_i0:101-1675(-)